MACSRERKAAIKKLKNLFFSLKSDVKNFRAKFDSVFSEPLLANNVQRSERLFGGISCDVFSPEIYITRRIIIYIHGGCFVGGSREAYRSFAASLASCASARAVLPEFRLAPTHPYPASLEDVQNVFRAVYSEELIATSLDTDVSCNSDGSNPQIILMADGSGASIALGLVLSLRDKYRSAISKIVLFSPWLDLGADSKKFTAKKVCDELYTAEAMFRAAEMYTFQNNRNLPSVSPLRAESNQLASFPPVYIQMGEEEFTLEDAEQFERKLLEAGAKCTLDVWTKMPAMFQLADEYFEEAHLAVEKIGRLFTERKTEKKSPQDF